jgi:hypothetical protein
VVGAYFIGAGKEEFIGTARMKVYYVGHCMISEFLVDGNV